MSANPGPGGGVFDDLPDCDVIFGVCYLAQKDAYAILRIVFAGEGEPIQEWPTKLRIDRVALVAAEGMSDMLMAFDPMAPDRPLAVTPWQDGFSYALQLAHETKRLLIELYWPHSLRRAIVRDGAVEVGPVMPIDENTYRAMKDGSNVVHEQITSRGGDA